MIENGIADYWLGFGLTPLDLMEAAHEYRSRAYAPYSRFTVGAAILLDDGSVVGGCNVENGSYGISICAERVAMSCAVASGKRNLLAVAVSGPSGVFCSPCGACRQFLSEFNPRAEIFLMEGDELRVFSLGSLLPYGFSLESDYIKGCGDDR